MVNILQPKMVKEVGFSSDAKKTASMIWYACYGSNMNIERFMIYIRGGKLVINGHTKTYRLCENDISLPKVDEPYVIHRRFYFAKSSLTWDNCGVGFISNKLNFRSITYARLYLISRTQFDHLFASENDRRRTIINYSRLENESRLDFDYNFYNRIILIERNYKGYPILTFTNNEYLPINSPLPEYVKLISKGLKTSHGLSDENIANYLKKSNVGLSKKELLSLIKN